MKIGTRWSTALAAALFATVGGAQDNEAEKNDGSLFRDWEVTGFVEWETRLFQQSPLNSAQHGGVGLSLAIEPEFYREWADGDYRFLGKPFYRFDVRDSERSHFDIRDLYVQKLSDQWEIKAGVSKVFWGVTESQHLVDVINQTDLVENFDIEDKLGQPMIDFTYLSDIGTFDLFYLPYFRARTFSGPDGRFRPNPAVDGELATYESDWEEWQPDVSLRWSQVLGEFDVGAHYFYGTSRDPLLQPATGGSRLQPVYNLMHQVGLDVQWTHDAWLLKFEGIHRSGRGQQFQGVATGYEYTLYQIFGSNSDLGVLTEYHYDSRGSSALTPFNNDFFFGTRLAMNDEKDTALLAGGFWDHRNGTSALRLEFERRLGSSYTLELELEKFVKTDRRDLFRSFHRDSFFEVSLRRYF